MAVMGNPDRFFPRGDDRFRVEVLDDDVLVLDVQTNIVHRVPGAEVDRLMSGTVTYATGHLPPGAERAIRDAVRAGSVRRRSLLVGGGALVASGILSTGLPFAAAAASLFPSPFDGATYTEGWNGQTDGGNWSISGAWDDVTIFAGAVPSAFQIVVHATSGESYLGEEVGSGHGAFIVATITGVPANRELVFALRIGGRGNDNRQATGGVAVGASVADPGGNNRVWLLAAGAGGGDGSEHAGGNAGVNGSGPNPGLRAVGSTGGAGGSGTRVVPNPPAPAPGDGRGYDAVDNPAGTSTLGRDQASGFFWGQGALLGGGGGAGWASGGGGGTDSGGGGGSSYINTSGSGPTVSSYSIYTVPRRYSGDGKTTRFEFFTPSP